MVGQVGVAALPSRIPESSPFNPLCDGAKEDDVTAFPHGANGKDGGSLLDTMETAG
jgi:hypothetical protein